MAIIVGTNSYVDEAFASSYIEEQGLDPVSNAASLIQASTAIDRIFGARFIGYKTNSTQKLAWPRIPTGAQETPDGYYFVDSQGNIRDYSVVPEEILQATVELAILIEEGTDIYSQPQANVVEEKTKIDVLETSFKYVDVGYKVVPLYKINLILSPLLVSRNGFKVVR